MRNLGGPESLGLKSQKCFAWDKRSLFYEKLGKRQMTGANYYLRKKTLGKQTNIKVLNQVCILEGYSTKCASSQSPLL